MKRMFYDCELVKVIDGDTFDAAIQVGLGLNATVRCRLAGVNAPERGEAGWEEATRFIDYWFKSNPKFTVVVEETQNYDDRWPVVVYYDIDATKSLNAELLKSGLAKEA